MANTKAEYRKDKLRFHNAPMFTSVASASTNVRGTGITADTSKLAVSCPIPAGTFTTQGSMGFRAKVAGICATSSGWMIATLRYNNEVILIAKSSTTTTKHRVYDNPYSFDFIGRISNFSSSGQITATCVATMGSATHLTQVTGTTGTTGGTNTKMSTSDLSLQTGSTLGLNVMVEMSATAVAAVPTVPATFTNNVAYIELFSG